MPAQLVGAPGQCLGPVERPGDGNTVNATSGAAFRQTNGASYREILDLSDWDRSVMTNVPGPAQPLYLAGRRIGRVMFWVPLSGHLGLGLSILSYAGEVMLGVATDAGLVPDPEAIVEGFHQEMAELARISSKTEVSSPAARK